MQARFDAAGIPAHASSREWHLANTGPWGSEEMMSYERAIREGLLRSVLAPRAADHRQARDLAARGLYCQPRCVDRESRMNAQPDTTGSCRPEGRLARSSATVTHRRAVARRGRRQDARRVGSGDRGRLCAGGRRRGGGHRSGREGGPQGIRGGALALDASERARPAPVEAVRRDRGECGGAGAAGDAR